MTKLSNGGKLEHGIYQPPIDSVEAFRKLGNVAKIEWMEKFGNETWKMQREVSNRKTLITKCQNEIFKWKRFDEE